MCYILIDDKCTARNDAKKNKLPKKKSEKKCLTYLRDKLYFFHRIAVNDASQSARSSIG